MLPQTGFERLPIIQAAFHQATSSPIAGFSVPRKRKRLLFAAEPLHNVYMSGFIRDNGLVSPLNRGTFYACRDEAGRIEGVALIGHVTQLDVRTDRAMKAFASAAQACPAVHVVMGESTSVREFWRHYSAVARSAVSPAVSYCSNSTYLLKLVGPHQDYVKLPLLICRRFCASSCNGCS